MLILYRRYSYDKTNLQSAESNLQLYLKVKKFVIIMSLETVCVYTSNQQLDCTKLSMQDQSCNIHPSMSAAKITGREIAPMECPEHLSSRRSQVSHSVIFSRGISSMLQTGSTSTQASFASASSQKSSISPSGDPQENWME